MTNEAIRHLYFLFASIILAPHVIVNGGNQLRQAEGEAGKAVRLRRDVTTDGRLRRDTNFAEGEIGGGGENRTPVLYERHCGFYMCIRLWRDRLPLPGLTYRLALIRH